MWYVTVMAPSARSPIPDYLDDPDEEFVTVFAALSDPIRVRMLRMMALYSQSDYPCTNFDDELPIAKSTISYHAQILRRANLIGVRKEGRNYFYRLRTDTLKHFAPALLKQFRTERSAATA